MGVGGISWDVTDTATKLVDKFSKNGNVKALSEGVVKKTILKYKREKSLANGYDFDEAEETAFAESDDDLVRVLKQAEAVIAEADAAIARVEADQKIKRKQSFKTSIDEEESVAEEVQIAQAEAIEQEKRIAEEANRNELIAQAEAIEQEKRIAQIAEEEEMAKIAEKKEIIKEVEQKVEEEDMTFDDDEFMAAVEMAQEGIEGKIIGVEDIITDSSAKADWAAAGDLASELRQDFEFNTDSDMNDEEEDEDIYNLGDVDLKALAQAARDAVESYENNAKEVDDADQ